MESSTEEIIEVLKEGGVGIIPTDTIYGLVGSAFVPETVERIYKLKSRNPAKPFIILISDIHQLEQFGVILDSELLKAITPYWPGPTSIILPVIDEQFEYLHRGTDSMAFRFPDDQDLLTLIHETGPLVAPSANPEARPPAESAEQAKSYFGTDVDFIIDGGPKEGKPSVVLSWQDGEMHVVRG